MFKEVVNEQFNPIIKYNGHIPDFYDSDEELRYHATTRYYYPGGDESNGSIFNETRLTRCLGCGIVLDAVISDDDTHLEYILASRNVSNKTRRTISEQYEHCEADVIQKQHSVKNRILVPTGELIVVNFFKGDSIDVPGHLRYTDYSLNHFMGIYRTMIHHANGNIGYGQMSNMSIGVFQDGNNITFGYPFDDENDLNMDHLKGTICLDMWRWMCIDKSLLPSDVTYNKDNSVTVHVEPGVYEIEQIFGINSSIKEEDTSDTYTVIKRRYE